MMRIDCLEDGRIICICKLFTYALIRLFARIFFARFMSEIVKGNFRS